MLPLIGVSDQIHDGNEDPAIIKEAKRLLFEISRSNMTDEHNKPNETEYKIDIQFSFFICYFHFHSILIDRLPTNS
jgi:hypothetical protein